MNNTPILLHDNDEFLKADIYLRGIEIYKKIISSIANLEWEVREMKINILLIYMPCIYAFHSLVHDNTENSRWLCETQREKLKKKIFFSLTKSSALFAPT